VGERRRDFEDSDFEENMASELRFHMDQYIEDLVRSGTPRTEATRQARLEFGSFDAVRADCREARGLRFFDEMRRQLHYALRLLRKSPGFTVTALLTLGICLGANLTIFAAIDAVLLRPLPFPDAQRLVTIFNTYPKAGVERDGASITNYYERRGHIPALASLSLYRPGSAVIGEAGSTQMIDFLRVTPDFFATLGTNLAMGRAFREDESGVVILTDAWWRDRMNADPNALGKSVRVDGHACEIIGVLPAGYRFLSSPARLYFPLVSQPADRTPANRHSGGNVVQMIARLRPGATVVQAQAQIDAQNHTLEQDNPEGAMMADAGFRSLVVPLHADHVAAIRPTLLLIQAGALVLLLIGAVNLVNLLLVRANGRIKESAVRQALGASRAHLLSEGVVETTVLALAGGVLGLCLGAAGIRALATFGAERIPLGAHIVFDWRIALAGLAASLATGIALALPIAWFYAGDHLAIALQSESRGGTAGRRAHVLRHSFVVAQIALALVMLVASGQLGLSLKRALAVSPGFRPGNVLTAQVSLPSTTYSTWPARLAFHERLLEQLKREPGVAAAGLVNNVPFSGRDGKSAASAKGYTGPPRAHIAYGVDGDYFTSMGLPLRAGRFLDAADSRRNASFCVVDEDFARIYWPGASALGREVLRAGGGESFTVVGVVGAVRQVSLTGEEGLGAVYYPIARNTDPSLYVVLRTSLPLTAALGRVTRRLDPDVAVSDARMMEERIADSLIARRSPAVLAALFSAIALLLTAVGTYGVLSYTVAQRRREIGLRMALGARPEQIRAQFLSLAARLFSAGAVVGVAGAWLAGQAIETVLFHVPALDLASLARAAGIMAAVCLAACLLPAHRAAHTSPLEALE
jgi:predicted permease